MLIQAFMAKYREMGGSAIFSYVADLLILRLGRYGSAIENIRLIFYLRGPARGTSPAGRKMFDEFHEFLHQLPKVRFSRRLKRVDIQFVSQQFTAEDEIGWQPSVEKCNRAMGEVLEALTLLKKSIKASDDFDLRRLLVDVAEVLRTPIESTEQWLEIRQQAGAIELAINAAQDRWESLEIDWDLYHPDARTILDDPFFWDSASDIAPHGNDTGADLLEDFQRWNRGHRNVSPLRFLDAEMAAWQVVPIDWSVTDENAVSALERDKSIEMTLCNEAAIALAFAVLKLRGQCPPDVKVNDCLPGGPRADSNCHPAQLTGGGPQNGMGSRDQVNAGETGIWVLSRPMMLAMCRG